MKLAASILLFAATIPLSASVFNPVPEPSTMLLVGGGLAAAVLIARKRKK
jgi:hypothetical protein